MQQSAEGQSRIKRQADRENEQLTRLLVQQDQAEEQAKKKARVEDTDEAPSSSTTPSQGASTKVLARSDDEGDQEMEVSVTERLCQDDFCWQLNSVEDMCEPDPAELQQYSADFAYFR